MTKVDVLISLLSLATLFAIGTIPSKPRPALVPAPGHELLYEMTSLPTGWRRMRVPVCTALLIITNFAIGAVSLYMP